jgi:hypothetical protein
LVEARLAWSLFLLITLPLLAGCGGSSGSNPTAAAPLRARNLNLIFVVSEDLAFQASGDVNPNTANLTNQGLQRSLRMATFLKRRVLGGKNVTGVYALEPMSHVQTIGNYPDIAALETIQQFALLNQITLSDAQPQRTGIPTPAPPFTGNGYPLNSSYGAAVPSGVASPAIACPNCRGLDFADQGGDNENLVTGIITANLAGFYVFSAPWETASAMLTKINQLESYNLNLPVSYAGPEVIYAISIAPSGRARLVTFNDHLNPASTYPALPEPAPVSTPCTAQAHFNIEVTGGIAGATTPIGINVNETLYLIRHAEAHPQTWWDDGNYICAGQWRALDLPNALAGRIIPAPQQVYSIDPAQVIPGAASASGNSLWSYVRPSLTVEPYAIANGLPYGLAAGFELFDMNSPQLASNFFFTGGQFSNQTVLMAWEHDHIPPTVNALLASYFTGGGGPAPAPGWPGDDYDTIWTVTLDGAGNLSVNNSTCEGISSAALPIRCPEF